MPQLRSREILPFEYDCIIGPDEIRLLFISDTANRDSEIRCEMHTFPRAEAPRYFAVSYVWGPPEFTHPIYLNNQILMITPNLSDLLKRLSEPSKYPFFDVGEVGEDLWFWVDAICINQLDLEEKSEQVRHMGDLYSQAEFTLAWLGESRDQEALAMDLINQVATAFQSGASKSFLRTALADPGYKEHFIALDNLFSKSWWRRIWTRQEAVAPPGIIFVCGESFCYNGPLSTVVEVFMTHLSSYAEDSLLDGDQSNLVVNKGPMHPENRGLILQTSGFLAAASTFRLRDIRFRRDHLSLLTLLSLVNDLAATDPRDLLYGLAGIADDGEELVGKPDYTKSVAQVYATSVHSSIVQRGKLDVICFVNVRNEDPDWPSWVPDLRNRHPHLHSMIGKEWTAWVNKDRAPSYCAHGNMDANASISADWTTLTVVGIVLDTLDGMGFAHDDRLRDTNETLKDSRKGPDQLNALSMVQSTSEVNTMRTSEIDESEKKEIHETLWRSMVDNRIDLGYPDEAMSEVFTKACILGVYGPGENLSRWAFVDFFHQDSELLLRSKPLKYWAIPTYVKGSPLPDQDEFAPAGSAAADYLLDASSRRRHHLRRIITTSKGHVGSASRYSRAGDKVCILFGCSTPVILRHEGDCWRLIGECYLHNFMNGEAIREHSAGKLQTQEFVIR